MDGKIIIGTEIDEKGFDKKYQQLKTRLENEEINLEIKTTNVEMAKRQLEEANKRVVDLKKEYDGLDNTIKGKTAAFNALKEQMNTGEISGEQYRLYGLLNSELSGLKAQQEEYFKSYDKLNEKINKSNDLLSKEEARLEIQKNKVEQIRSEFQQLNSEIALSGNENLVKMDSSVKSIGKSLEKVTRKIGKMALAVFGIRSAFMFVRNAINTIASNDEKLKADIEYIRTALAYTLEPIVRAIVNLAKQLLSYLGYIIKAWTGRDIFASTNKSLKNANGQAKKLQRTLAGFDEMNVLSDNSTEGAGGGSAGFSAPTDADVPGWIKFIAENKDGILAVMAGVAAGLTAWKLGLKGIQSLGIGIAIAGVVLAIQKLIDFLKDPTFENFIGILKGIALAVLGVAIAIGAWPVAVGAAIALVVILILKHFDKIKKWFDDLLSWVGTKLYDKLSELLGPTFANTIVTPIKAVLSCIKTIFEDVFGGIKEIVQGIISLFKGDFKRGITQVFNGLRSVVMAPINALVSAINAVIEGLNKISIDIPDWVPIVGGKKFGFNLPRIPKLAKGGIVNMPGRGVPVGGALAGEVNREGVIPLTDSQQMALLGEAIGKYITINANIVNTMNGRVISRELQRVQNDSDFAFNR